MSRYTITMGYRFSLLIGGVLGTVTQTQIEKTLLSQKRNDMRVLAIRHIIIDRHSKTTRKTKKHC